MDPITFLLPLLWSQVSRQSELVPQSLQFADVNDRSLVEGLASPARREATRGTRRWIRDHGMTTTDDLFVQERLPLIVVEIEVRDQLAREVGREELVPESEEWCDYVLEKVCPRSARQQQHRQSPREPPTCLDLRHRRLVAIANRSDRQIELPFEVPLTVELGADQL